LRPRFYNLQAILRCTFLIQIKSHPKDKSGSCKTFRICLADCVAEASLIEQPQRSIPAAARPAARRIQQRRKKLAEKQ